MADFFERKGIDLQLSCTSKAEAKQVFEYSCNCCKANTRFLWKPCEHCPIAITHEQMCAYWDDEARRKVNENKGE